MANFILLHDKTRGEIAVNVDHIAYIGASTEESKVKYPGYVLLNRAQMWGLETKETPREIFAILRLFEE